MNEEELLEQYGELVTAGRNALAEAIMDAYKERCKATVFDLLSKGPLTNREIEWCVSRITVITANVMSIFIALDNNDDNTEESNDE